MKTEAEPDVDEVADETGNDDADAAEPVAGYVGTSRIDLAGHSKTHKRERKEAQRAKRREARAHSAKSSPAEALGVREALKECEAVLARCDPSVREVAVSFLERPQKGEAFGPRDAYDVCRHAFSQLEPSARKAVLDFLVVTECA